MKANNKHGIIVPKMQTILFVFTKKNFQARNMPKKVDINSLNDINETILALKM